MFDVFIGKSAATPALFDTVRLVKVDRSPVTREWTADTDGGTGDNGVPQMPLQVPELREATAK